MRANHTLRLSSAVLLCLAIPLPAVIAQPSRERSMQDERDDAWPSAYAAPRIFDAPNAVSTWTGGSGNWSDSSMWSPAAVPNDPTADVFVDGGKSNFNSTVQMDGNFTVGRLTIDSGDAVFLQDNRAFTITNSGGLGSLVTNGTFTIGSGGNNTDLRFFGDLALSGSGSVVGSNSLANRFYAGDGTSRVTIANGTTLSGSLQFGLDQTKFTNNGLIDANTSGGMLIDPANNVGDAINNGTMRASSGATLTLNLGNYTNTNGIIRALTGGVVNLLNGAVITGGTLTTTDLTGSGGIIQSGNDATVSGVTNTGYLLVPDNRNLRLAGTITNNGVIVLGSAGNTANLILSGDVTLNGSGTVSASNVLANRIFSASGLDRLTIAGGMTLQGSYQLGLDQMKFTNNGLIDATGSAGVIVDPTNAAGDAVNNGTMRASNGGSLTLTFGNYTNTSGTITALAGGVVNLSGNAVINGGTFTTADLTGSGGVIQSGNDATIAGVTNAGFLLVPDNRTLRLSGSLVNNGLLFLGSAGNTSSLILSNDVTLSGNGTLSTSNTTANRIFAGNTTSRLTIANGATLSGSLSFGLDQMKFTNNGLVDANLSGGMNIDPTNDPTDAVNNATMQASNGGTMTLFFGNYTNNGTIQALNGSAVNLRDNARIIGGTITTAGTGVVQTVNDSALDGVTNNGSLFIPDNTRLRLFTSFVNNGTLTMNSGGNNTELRIGTDLTVSGTGTITTSNTQANRIFGLAGTERLTIGNGYTIQGSMAFGADLMRFTNNGTIDANQTAGMTIDPTNAAGDAVNNGIMQASNSATMTLAQAIYTNTSGTIRALNGSAVNLRDGALIDGGIVTTQGTGVVQTINDASLQNVTNNGLVNIPDNTRLRLFGSFTNNGTLMMNSGGNNTELRIGNDLTISGSGVLNSSNTQANRIFGVNGTERLTIANGYTLQGSFQLGADLMKFTNNGTIRANTSAGLTIDPTNALGDAVNSGIIEATNAATLTLNFGNYSNASGTIRATTGSFVNLRDNALVIGGTLTTTDLTGSGGVIQSINDASLQDLTNSGFVRVPDNTRLRLIGTIVDNGVIQMASGGNNTEIRISGDVSLNGTGTLTGSNTIANRLFALNSGSETLTNGAGHTINGTMQLGVDFMNLVNNGVIDSNTGSITIDPTSTATNNSTGVFRASNGATLNLINGSYTNNGTYEALTGSTVQMNGGAALTNYDSGTMTMTGGTYRAVSTGGQATLNLNIGQIANNAASIVLDGVNTIIHTSDNTTDALTPFNNNTSTGSFTITNGRNFDRTFAFNNAGLVTVGPSSLFTATQFDLSGTLTGAGTLTVSGALNWTQGTMSGSGITNANGALNLTTTANRILNARTVNSAATTTWSGSGTWSAGDGAVFNNLTGATFNGSNTQAMAYSGTGAAATFNNSGAFNKTGSGTGTSIDAIFNNTGTVNINSGLLTLQRGGTDTGAFNDSAGASLTFGGGTHALNAGASVTGAGAVNFFAGTANFASGATYNISGLTSFTGGTASFANAASAAATNFISGTLTGTGTYNSSGLFTWSGGVMSGTGITNANAGLVLNGGTRTLVSRTLNNNTTATWDAGDFSAGQGAVFNNPSGSAFNDTVDASWLFDQGGTLTQFNNGGTFTKSGGSGTTLLQLAFNNSGALNANSGTLSFSQGLQGTSGTVTVASGATLSVSGGSTASSAGMLSVNGNLSLGSNNFNVAVDYTNANFGTGNSFNPRANVSGTGGINATGNVNQTVSGNVTNGTTASPTIAFGNFHVGDPSVSKTFAINNSGSSGPSLRGAIQTSANGGNITDGRLSGSGVTAANFGPLTPGASAGNFMVTFNPSSAGALSGQVVHLMNNFDNVQDQNISLTGGVYRLAAASAHSPEPVSFGIVHIGDTPSQSLSITNAVANDGFSEKLDGAIGSATGGVTASGSFSQLAPGSTSSSLAVGINTATAGTKNGTATISLVSNGTGTSGLTNTNLTSQTVNVSGQVNYYADPVVIFKSGMATLTMQSPTMFTLDFGTVAQNSGTYLATFGLQNFLHDAVFQDLLGGTFDLTMLGSFGVTNTGPFSGVAPGSSNDSDVTFNSSMTVGTYNGQLRISPTSTNASSSSNLTVVTLNLQGTVVPEPATWALLLAGAGVLIVRRRIRGRVR